ncbi:U6 snRNA phosphodiesterase Usb1 [Whalleya microplaca]|nr:U6 snRNA phosphodiesterase Usb1 [Whalleya microplaca]
MALVDYSSSDSEPEPESAAEATSTSRAVKRRKTSLDQHEDGRTEPGKSALPPLPSAFHDLYASTVRVSTTDDPTLHQGRKRVNPHKVGNWPSHLYIEWHPTPSERTTLSTLLTSIQSAISGVTLTSFLTSDLGAPQPLHISLSRPIVLGTAQKDDFLAQLVAGVGRSGVGPFDLFPCALAWHRTAESARSFLVLRVASTSTPADSVTPTTTGTTVASTTTTTTAAANSNPNPNPELTTLLSTSNALARSFSQPPLYASSSSSSSSGVGSAFHISLAWTFAPPDAELTRVTEAAFGAGDAVRGMRVRVEGVKAKIGNVVTHVGLPVRGRGDGGRGLFGV